MTIRKKLFVLLGILVLATAQYYLASKFAIRHETVSWLDTSRNREVVVTLAVRRDSEMKAIAGIQKLPVAIVSHGNTVRNTEYSFIANVLAARGYLVASIQHDLPSDVPLMTKPGSLYVGRLGVYERGLKNIFFALGNLKKLLPDADYDHLTLVGHSNGGDISMFFAQQHPEMVRRVVTLDNLRVPFVTSGAARILSFRSNDPRFKTDPGVLPDDQTAKEAGIDIVPTDFQHTDMSDRGPEEVKEKIQSTLDQFLSKEESSNLAPVVPRKPAADPRAMGP